MKTNVLFQRGVNFIQQLPHFAWYIFCRAKQNRLRVAAGYLAYVTLLSIVPLVSVVFSMLSAFPVFDEIKLQIEQYVYSNFLPTASDIIQKNLTEFVDNASKASAVGITALILFALLLISNIDKVLNEIWRSPTKRPIVISFSIYWMVLTLGPLLLGASVAISSYVLSLGGLQTGMFSELVAFFLRWLPLLFSVLAFLMMYLIVPNVRVRFFDALIGALAAAVLFELSKNVFALYISYFPSYQAIYGALATIPILFIWVYLSWIVVLIGAELTAGLPEFYQRSDDDNQTEQQVGENADPLPRDKTI